ncbi:hypothetical protein GE061_007791 [Apolygus lucorum]|uniref:Uncharacterized protein n=1 Tax=Apolygus lucorum TaxID=248454 RepID=A0A8S9WRJ3_APOLU|nr:hypothetical protein GE061_007791 [Apolygus lucorum]
MEVDRAVGDGVTLYDTGSLPLFYVMIGASQVIFHAVFDTYKEDLSLLPWMTSFTQKWLKRGAMTDFKELEKKNRIPVSDPVFVLKYSKPSASNQSQFFTSEIQQVATIPCFSGGHTTKVESLLKYLRDSSNVDSGTKGKFSGLRMLIVNLTNQLVRKVEANQIIVTWGNAEWLKVLRNGFGEVIKEVPPFSGEMFMSTDDEISLLASR